MLYELLVPEEAVDRIFLLQPNYRHGTWTFSNDTQHVFFRDEVLLWCADNLTQGISMGLGRDPDNNRMLAFTVTLANDEDAALFRLTWL